MLFEPWFEIKKNKNNKKGIWLGGEELRLGAMSIRVFQRASNIKIQLSVLV
jgi:hypothetical protein